MIAIFPELASAAASGDIEVLAVLVRKYFGGKRQQEPRILVSTLIEASGIKLVHAPLQYNGALLVKDDLGRIDVSMIINESVGHQDRSLLMAHLFGHFLLHCQPLLARGDWPNTGFNEKTMPLQRMQQKESNNNSEMTTEMKAEAEADRFATALLMPKGMFKRAVQKLKHPEKVAAIFGVPLAAVMARAETMDEIAEVPVNFLEAEGQLSREKQTKNKQPPTATTRAQPNPLTAASGVGMPQMKERRTSQQGLSQSFAAANYRQNAAEAKKSVAVVAKATTPENKSESGSGMSRIRELARKLDPSV